MEYKDFDKYIINNDGTVYSKVYKKILKGSKDKDGYIIYRLRKDKKTFTIKGHRLIAETFIENKNNLAEIDHINKIKDDNRVCNLRWSNRCLNNTNKNFQGNKLNEPYISKNKNGFQINIRRNYLIYYKWCNNFEKAKKQRDLMLSMWSNI
tara:strand:- start:198 stop:650 length:453 start_codon:yes stop_codon:yes gene_type:complete